METKRTPKRNINRLNLFVDIIVALVFIVEMEERFTGLRNHELIGLAIAVVVLVHILLHWRWVLSITRQFFRNLFHESRLNYVLNWALFLDTMVIIVTGIGISRTLGLNLGLGRDVMGSWQRIHILASHLSLILAGVHVGLHWKWIASHGWKYLFRPVMRVFGRVGSLRPAPVRLLSDTSTQN